MGRKTESLESPPLPPQEDQLKGLLVSSSKEDLPESAADMKEGLVYYLKFQGIHSQHYLKNTLNDSLTYCRCI